MVKTGCENTTRHAPEVEKHPFFKGNAPPDAPVSKGITNLTTESGPRLQLMSRISNRETMQAVAIANIYTNIYGSAYVKGRIDEILRVNVGRDGLGRREIIDIVEAGGSLPPEYYTGQNRKGYQILGTSPGDE